MAAIEIEQRIVEAKLMTLTDITIVLKEEDGENI